MALYTILYIPKHCIGVSYNITNYREIGKCRSNDLMSVYRIPRRYTYLNIYISTYYYPPTNLSVY